LNLVLGIPTPSPRMEGPHRLNTLQVNGFFEFARRRLSRHRLVCALISKLTSFWRSPAHAQTNRVAHATRARRHPRNGFGHGKWVESKSIQLTRETVAQRLVLHRTVTPPTGCRQPGKNRQGPLVRQFGKLPGGGCLGGNHPQSVSGQRCQSSPVVAPGWVVSW